MKKQPESVDMRTKVLGPPVQVLRQNDGSNVQEDQSYVGWVEAPQDAERTLSLYGIYLRFARFNPRTQRWEACLFSRQTADMLETLSTEGEFPFAFQAEPSLGEAMWLAAKANGATERPKLELQLYFLPATQQAIEGIRDETARPRARQGGPHERHLASSRPEHDQSTETAPSNSRKQQ